MGDEKTDYEDDPIYPVVSLLDIKLIPNIIISDAHNGAPLFTDDIHNF